MQDSDETTYQCHPNHPQILKDLLMKSLGQDVDAKELRSNLQVCISQTRESKLITLDAHSRCNRFGDSNTESDGQGVLLPSVRAGESADKTLKIADEDQRDGEQSQPHRSYLQVFGGGSTVAVSITLPVLPPLFEGLASSYAL